MADRIRIKAGAFEVRAGRTPGLEVLKREDPAAELACNPAGLPSVWSIYDPVSGTLEDLPDSAPCVGCRCVPRPDGADWQMTVDAAHGRVTAVLSLRASGSVLRFTLDQVEESERAHLVTVRLNGLAAAVSADAAARVALPSRGGRLIDPSVCGDGQTDHRYNWILDSFGSAAVVYTERMTAVVRIRLMDDQLTSQTGSFPGGRYAQIGALLRRRYTKLDVSYRRAKPDRDPASAEDAEARPVSGDFLLDRAPCADITLIGHDAVLPSEGWTVGACHVRDSLPGKCTDWYRGRMVYKIFVGAPGQPVATSLDQIRSLITGLAARTGQAGQVAYLVGFQHRGHDSGYPDVFSLNPALESLSALKALAEEVRPLNCVLSFHDNYDDAYASSPSWDPEDISRDHTGHLLRGGVWNGVQAYWNSMPFYAANRSAERIRRTLEMYPFLRGTYHLDVLTASVFRVDFRENSPTGREDDRRARLEIVRQFRSRGLDVSSEACGLPFIGHISYFWHMQRVPRSLYPGDTRIPMVPFLVHGKADYAGTHTDDMHSILDGLLYGAFYCNDVTAATPVKQLTDAYFMLQAPLDRLRDETAESYAESSGWKYVRYASGAEIGVNFETEECRVTIGGRRWIENGTAMIPEQDGSTLLYRFREEPYEDVRWQTGLPAGTLLDAVPLGTDEPPRVLKTGPDGAVPVDTTVGVAWRAMRRSL